jgi:hypothetical protein
MNGIKLEFKQLIHEYFTVLNESPKKGTDNKGVVFFAF